MTREDRPDGGYSTHTYHGLTTSVSNDHSQTTITVRNPLDLVATVTDAASHTTSYVYDAFGDLTQVTDAGGNVTTNAYDRRGNKISTTDPDIGHWSYAYDAAGELISQTDAKSQTTTLVYDQEGRLTSRTEPDMTSTWTYGTSAANDNIDKLVTAAITATTGAGYSGYSRSLAYDSIGRPVTTTFAVNGTNYTYTTAYNMTNGKIASVTNPSGLTLNYGYTSLGYLQTQTDPVTNKDYWTANSRDAEMHLTQETAGNGVVTTNTFDPNTGYMQTVRAGTSNSVASFDYTFDTLGNLTNRQDDIEGVFESYCYDALNRLTNYLVAQGSSTACNATGSKTVGYDSLGDITSKTGVGTYSYPAAGQAHPHAVSGITGTVNGVTNPAYTYDSNGNMTAGAGRTVTYSSFNMPTSISQGALTNAFVYDPEHQRVEQSQTTGSTTTHTFYLNDPVSGSMAELHLAADGTPTWWDYVLADGKVAAQRALTSGTVTNSYFVLDHLGSVAVATDDSGSGTTAERDGFDAWGAPRNIDGSDDTTCSKTSVTTRGFTNQEEINALCLVNLNARVYDPTIGRFMVPDSIVPDTYNGQSLNRYTYVENGPLSYTDPTGHFGADPASYGFGVNGIGIDLIMGEPECTCGNPQAPLLNLFSIGLEEPFFTNLTPSSNYNAFVGFDVSSETVNAVSALRRTNYSRGDSHSPGQRHVASTTTTEEDGTSVGGSTGTNGGYVQTGYDVGTHSYNFSVPLCLGCSPQSAFDVVRSFSAPGAPYAQTGTHKVILTGNNPILQTVDPKALTITNTTLPGHVFYPGTVQLSVVQDQAGVVTLNVNGNGSGAYSTDNQIFGPVIFFSLGMAAYGALNPNTGVNTSPFGPH